mgnify:CR=1 FL=1
MSSLYLEHFRLGEAPFGITPNGKFFFEGQARGAILDALHHAVLDEDGIVDAIERVTDKYVELREGGERFLDTYRRVGFDPFKEAIYG